MLESYYRNQSNRGRFNATNIRWHMLTPCFGVADTFTESPNRALVMRGANAIHWTATQYREYQAHRTVQLPLGRGVAGLDRPRRIVDCALEAKEAEALMQWVNFEGARLYPELGFLYAVPNGGFRHKAVATKMKAQGVRAGALDFNLDVARGPYHGLRMELKRRVGGTVSPAQKIWIRWLTNQGYLAIVCRGWEEARDRIVDYLSISSPAPAIVLFERSHGSNDSAMEMAKCSTAA